MHRSGRLAKKVQERLSELFARLTGGPGSGSIVHRDSVVSFLETAEDSARCYLLWGGTWMTDSTLPSLVASPTRQTHSRVCHP